MMKIIEIARVSAISLLVMFLLSGIGFASEKVKGDVNATFQNESLCKVATTLTGKSSVCKKDADKKVASIIAVSLEKETKGLKKDQTVIIKIKGCGKSTGKIVAVADGNVTSEETGAVKEDAPLMVLKNGKSGLVFIEMSKPIKAENGAHVKIILKKSAPKVEGC